MGDTSLIKLQQWVAVAVKDQHFVNYEFEVEGQTGKGDGYGSDINFVKVTGADESGAQKILRLAVKSSKQNEKLREQVPIREACLKEVYIYDQVKPTYDKFLQEKKVRKPINFMPHCYGTDDETLIFENLRTENFQLWDKTRPMTTKHVQMVLEAYGRWHALSMALKNQKPDVFKNLIKGSTNMFSEVVVQLKFHLSMWTEFHNAIKSIAGNDEKFLKELQYSQNDIDYALTGMFYEDPDHHVILHGDCWNNNYLFKFLDDKTNPSELRILDWQCSGLGSPAFDLSHFIYCCADTGKHDYKELLQIYHNSFSKCLVSVGCDPKIFPFETLLQQWKKFSRFGLFLSSLIIRICLKDNNEIADFDESAKKGQDLNEGFKFEESKDEVFLTRVKNNLLHYCKSVEEINI